MYRAKEDLDHVLWLREQFRDKGKELLAKFDAADGHHANEWKASWSNM